MKKIVLLTVMGAAALWAGEDVWTSLGPEGGVVRSLVTDPSNANTVYALTTAGLYKSTDGGTNWGVIPGLPPNSDAVVSLVIDPKTPGTLYAATRDAMNGGDPRRDGAFKSTDGGVSWRALRSGSFTISGPLAIDPEDPRIIYSGGYNEILKSTDGGETWKTSYSGPPNVTCCIIIRSLLILPKTPSTVYAVAGIAIFKSTNRGESWSAVYPYSGRVEDPQFETVSIDPQDSNTLYGLQIGFGGVHKSTDGGASWSAASSGLPTSPDGAPSALAVHPQTGGMLYAATRQGLFKSSDAAANWTKLDSQPGGGGVHVLALGRQDSGTIYAAGDDLTGASLYKSTDGGANWSSANSGIRAIPIFRLTTVPQRPDTLYADTADRLLKSIDGGKSWNQLESRYLLGIDPQNPGTLFATHHGTLTKSTDEGESWSPANLGLPEDSCENVSTLAFDPRDTRSIYAGVMSFPCQTRSGGVWKSTDGGAKWAKLESKPEGGGVHGVEIDPNTAGTLYAWNGKGAFKSVDDGTSWSKLRSGFVRLLTIDRQTPGTLYAVFNYEQLPGEDTSGVYKTTDGGESWSVMKTLQVDVTALVVDARNAGTLYAGTSANGVYKTTDGGANWSAVNSGLTTLKVYALAIDQRSSTLYAGTEGGVFTITFAAQ